jgi:hypothetical protein
MLAIGVMVGFASSRLTAKAAQAGPAGEGSESKDLLNQLLVGKEVYIEFQSYHSLNVGEGRISGIAGNVVAVGEGMVTVRTSGGFNRDHPVASVPTSSILVMWSGKPSDATTQP